MKIINEKILCALKFGKISTDEGPTNASVKVKQSSIRYWMTDEAQKEIRVLYKTSHLVTCTGVLEAD